MEPKRKKFTPHSEETIIRILEMHDAGMRSKDIYKNSKGLFGFCVKQSTISNILSRNGRNAKDNTYRIKKGSKFPRKLETIKDFPALYKYNQTPENTYIPKVDGSAETSPEGNSAQQIQSTNEFTEEPEEFEEPEENE